MSLCLSVVLCCSSWNENESETDLAAWANRLEYFGLELLVMLALLGEIELKRKRLTPLFKLASMLNLN